MIINISLKKCSVFCNAVQCETKKFAMQCSGMRKKLSSSRATHGMQKKCSAAQRKILSLLKISNAADLLRFERLTVGTWLGLRLSLLWTSFETTNELNHFIGLLLKTFNCRPEGSDISTGQLVHANCKKSMHNLI